ncbi:hypothetical protein I6F65_20430 [Pseudoalteromonas sp. SWXJZ94C]|uniref:hypothetical protein n=2 Tax=unclassified Pseudoalteromonas TaxID=194690 RepID=UPI0018CD1697|nr:hypothetical protein [Pseudoalteromonas sp. SWXJZ94C]MBH0059312.1 hypothetical protein [Pseudoalteromonas sp. SWXJZ94C]
MSGFLFVLVSIFVILSLFYVFVSLFNFINSDKIERAHYLKFLDEKLKEITPERLLTKAEAAAMSDFYGEPIEAKEPVYRISGSFGPFLIRDKKWGKPARLRRFFERFEIDIDIVKQLEFCIDENNTVEFILPARQRGALAVSIDDSFNVVSHRDLDKIGQTQYHLEETDVQVTYDEYCRANIDKRRIPSLFVALLLMAYPFVDNTLIAGIILFLVFVIFIGWVLPRPFYKTDFSKKFRVKLTGRLRGQAGSYRLGPYYINLNNFTARLKDMIGEAKEITIEGLLEEGRDAKVISVLSLNGNYFNHAAYSKKEEFKGSILEREVNRKKRFAYLFLFMLFPFFYTLTTTDMSNNLDDLVTQLSVRELQREFNGLEEFRNYPLVVNQEVIVNNLSLLPNIDKFPGYNTLVPTGWKHDIDLSQINERIALIGQIQYTKELFMTIISSKTSNMSQSPYRYFRDDPNYSKLQKKSLFVHYATSFPESYYFKLLLEICYVEAKYELEFGQKYVLDENSQMLREYLTKKYKYKTLIEKLSSNTLLNEKQKIFKGFINEQKNVIIDELLKQGDEQVAKSNGIAFGPNYRRLNPFKPTLLRDDFYIIRPTDKYSQSNTKNSYRLVETLPAVSSVKNISETLLEVDDYLINGIITKINRDDNKLTKVLIDQNKHYDSLFHNVLDIIHAWMVYILFILSLLVGRVFRVGQY